LLPGDDVKGYAHFNPAIKVCVYSNIRIEIIEIIPEQSSSKCDLGQKTGLHVRSKIEHM